MVEITASVGTVTVEGAARGKLEKELDNWKQEYPYLQDKIKQETGETESGTWKWSYDSTDGPDQSQTVTLTAKDSDGAETSTTFELIVNNVAPEVAADEISVAVNESETATNTGTHSDVGDDTIHLTASVGTIVDNDDGTWDWSYATTDGPDQSQTVIITATDSDGAETTTMFELVVSNVAPEVAADNASVAASESQTATNTGTHSDVGDDTIALSASVGTIVDNNDGTWSWSYATTDGPDQSQTVTITAMDSDGDANTTTFELVVNNVAPEVDADEDTVTVDESETATNTGTHSDVGDDTIALSASVGTIIDEGSGIWSWSYASTDGPDQSQTVTVTATDSDGAQTTTTFELVVNNVAPQVSADQSSVVVDEGQTAQNTGTHSDVGDDAIALTRFGGHGNRMRVMASGAGPTPAPMDRTRAGR